MIPLTVCIWHLRDSETWIWYNLPLQIHTHIQAAIVKTDDTCWATEKTWLSKYSLSSRIVYEHHDGTSGTRSDTRAVVGEQLNEWRNAFTLDCLVFASQHDAAMETQHKGSHTDKNRTELQKLYRQSGHMTKHLKTDFTDDDSPCVNLNIVQTFSNERWWLMSVTYVR